MITSPNKTSPSKPLSIVKTKTAPKIIEFKIDNKPFFVALSLAIFKSCLLK